MSLYDGKEERGKDSVCLFRLDEGVFSLPNETAAERLTLFLAETWANRECSFLEGLTPWEYALLHGVEDTVQRLQENWPADEGLLPVLRPMLAPPGTGGRYVEAYQRSGGLLNIFNPWATEADDDQWAEMKAGIGHLEGPARTEAQREIAGLWNETANDLFSGLTPAQVWAGSGPQERQLAVQALQWIEENVAPERSSPPGESLCAHLKALRLWQLQPQRKLKKRSPMQVILTERERILAQREEFLRRIEGEKGLAR